MKKFLIISIGFLAVLVPSISFASNLKYSTGDITAHTQLGVSTDYAGGVISSSTIPSPWLSWKLDHIELAIESDTNSTSSIQLSIALNGNSTSTWVEHTIPENSVYSFDFSNQDITIHPLDQVKVWMRMNYVGGTRVVNFLASTNFDGSSGTDVWDFGNTGQANLITKGIYTALYDDTAITFTSSTWTGSYGATAPDFSFTSSTFGWNGTNWESTSSPFYVDCSAYDNIQFFASGTMGMIRCSIQKTTYGIAGALLIPSSGSLDTFANSITDFKNTFPFKIFYGYTGAIQTGINSTSTQNYDISLTLPPFPTINILTSSTLEQSFGSSTKEMIFNIEEKIMWIGTGAAMILLFLL